MKPGKPLLQSVRLLDQVQERIRYLLYSHSTKKLICTGSNPLAWLEASTRHMRTKEVDAFLMLANERSTGASLYSCSSKIRFISLHKRLKNDRT